MRSEFIEGVVSSFDFLTRDFGFRAVAPNSESSLESVQFEKPPLSIGVGWYKGEVDVNLAVSLDTSVLRPYRRKSFRIAEIAQHLNPDIFQERPELPQSAIAPADALVFVRFYGSLIKEHCQEILRGDLKTLEEIVLENES